MAHRRAPTRFASGKSDTAGLLAAAVFVVAGGAHAIAGEEDAFRWRRHLLESPLLLDDPAGARSLLEERGLAFDLYYNHYYGANLRGGVDTSGAGEHSGSFDLFARADFDELGLVIGGRSLLQVKSVYGRNVNPAVGALADPIDDADFDETIWIDQLWYQRAFLDGRLAFRIGYVDQQAAIDRNAYANAEDRQFLSAFLDNNPVVPLRIGPGVTVFVRPTEWLDVTAGMADGENPVLRTGFDTAFDDLESLTGYLEAGLRFRPETARGVLEGNYRFGTFYDAREREVFGPGPGEIDRGSAGFYISFDQLLFRESPDDLQGLGAFVRYGLADDRVNRIAHFWSVGFAYEGIFPGRADDTLGLAMYQAIVSERSREVVGPGFDRETGFEIYYRARVTGWLDVTPDLQLIRDPGGFASARDALVFVLRARVTF